MTNDQLDHIIAGLSERQQRFIMRVATQDFAPACRHEDRARQGLRRKGLTRYQRKGAKWLLTPTGLAVRSRLLEMNDE